MSSPPPASPPMVWPAPPGGNVVPFPLPWGQTGCCPPGGMDALMQCYCDVQAATAFICSVMVQCIQQNPAVTQAIIAAIAASGSNLPLLGVTNGSDAQPGQVGEWVRFAQSTPVATGSTTTTLSMGVLSPGDWDTWLYCDPSTAIHDISLYLNPQPPGFTDALTTVSFAATDEVVSPASTTVRASLTVPTLIPVFVGTNQTAAGPGAGTVNVIFSARRVR